MKYLYNIVIQENLSNGSTFMHTLPLDASYVQEALGMREKDYHSDCVFVPEYTLN